MSFKLDKYISILAEELQKKALERFNTVKVGWQEFVSCYIFWTVNMFGLQAYSV